MTLLPLFEWLDQTSLATAFHASVWAFAASETLHLLFLAALGGRLSQLRCVYWPSLVGVIVSGTLMVTGEALKVYNHPAFRWKMALFAIALALSHGLHGKASKSTEPLDNTVRVLAAANLLVWLATGLAGRAVGLL
jgi:hypothetical protein